MTEVVIVAARRSPLGSFGGSLKGISAVDLAATVLKETLKDINLDPKEVNEVILGNVLSAGLGQNVARQVSMHAGLPQETPALTINKVCGSGLKTIMLGAQSIMVGDNDVVVVGGGNVGRKIIALAQSYGLEVLLNDLPREEVENGEFHSLKELAELADIITFHVPLYTEGRFKTYHLADASFFKSLKKKPIIINTSRGEVIETEALLDAINKDEVSYPIIDVWENEPYINKALLYKTFIGTPHIAGYSADGKANATQMALESCCRFFEIPCNCTIYPPKPTQTVIRGLTVEECLLKIYNPMRDNDLLKVDPTQFEYIRGNYPLRREKKAYSIQIL